MTTTPTDLAPIVAFIEARLREDEAVAREAQGLATGRWRARLNGARVMVETDATHSFAITDLGWLQQSEATHIARHDPARVLAQVAALRAIVADCDEMLGYSEKSSAPVLAAATLRHVAAIWVGHDEWDGAWA